MRTVRRRCQLGYFLARGEQRWGQLAISAFERARRAVPESVGTTSTSDAIGERGCSLQTMPIAQAVVIGVAAPAIRGGRVAWGVVNGDVTPWKITHRGRT